MFFLSKSENKLTKLSVHMKVKKHMFKYNSDKCKIEIVDK